MKKTFIIIVIMFNFFNKASANYTKLAHNFEFKSIDGQSIKISDYKEKVIVVVNVASRCGFTKQYDDLQNLWTNYKDNDLVVIGVPTNDFKQEPGSNKDIGEFCEKNYGVSFPMMEKISVKGSDMHPLYKFLTSKNKNGYKDSSVKWNFQKYLINENGYLEKIISPRTKPDDPSVIQWIKT